MLALSLLLLTGMPLVGCSRENSMTDAELAPQAFPDDARMAEIAAAVARGDIDAVKRLHPTVDLDARGDKEVTLLQWAIFTNSHVGFVALLDAGADPHGMGMDGESAVHFAVSFPNPKFLATLIERREDLNIAASNGGHGPRATDLGTDGWTG